jgi:hypothetical protein
MISQDQNAEFSTLFEDFVRNYLSLPQGQAHLSRYEACKVQGRENFNKVTAAATRSEEITDLVLRLLLPYTDSATHRESGVWIHIAPAIQGDVKEWFQGAGWTNPDDWPKIANAIFSFVSRVTKEPAELDAACGEFTRLPYTTGFQTGLLTPILNAVRPDVFLIVNNKSRQMINHFSGNTFRQHLTEYPGSNTAGWDLINRFAAHMGEVSNSTSPPADLLDVFAHWLVAIRKYAFGKVRYWKIAPGESARLWDDWQRNGYIAIGWDELGDMSGVGRAEFDTRVARARVDHPNWSKVGLNQVWEFAHIMEGDRVVANRGTTELLGIGTVTAPYEFIAGVSYGHRIPVDWDDVTPRNINEGGWRRTLVQLKPEKFEQLRESQPISGPTPERYTLAKCASDTGIDEDAISQWLRAIERKGQAILYGPPGTGKTYVAERLARHLSSEGDGFSQLIQFHPSYAYEDFIQGIRPTTQQDGSLRYPMVKGRLLEFCDKARPRHGTCVLVIDEINRAELSRVFGELMYLLEYRARTIPLAGGELFGIPTNVRIIGTMNTADRSIALVDHALRRRFAFIGLYPNYEILIGYHQKTGYGVSGLIEVLRLVNDAIGDKHYSLGVSYFLREDLGTQIEDVWRMEIEPYLEEYFFDQPNKVDDLRWDKVADRITP